MKIVKFEKITLSNKEIETWDNFTQMLKDLDRESESSYILDLVHNILNYMSELYKEVE